MAAVEIKVVSWNIKDFGTYDFTTTMIDMIEELQTADIIVIMEIACDRFTKLMPLGSDGTRTAAFEAAEDLRDRLEKNDGGTQWSAMISGVNAGSTRRDAYAFFWKDEPTKSKYTSGPLVPAKIEPDGEPDVLDTSQLTFPDRRPALQKFKLTDNGAAVHSIAVVGFHASIPVNSSTAVASMTAMAATPQIQNASDIIICCDTNVDFNKNLLFYKNLTATYKMSVCLGNVNTAGSGVATSLIRSWPKGGTDNVASSAYDNMFYRGPNLSLTMASVVDVVANYGKRNYPGLSPSRQLYNAWKEVYPKHQCASPYSKKHAKKPSAMSDHLPIFGHFSIQ